MRLARRFRLLSTALLLTGLTACSNDQTGPDEAHSPADAAVFLDGVDMSQGLFLGAGETVRLEIRFYNRQGQEITGIADDHFAALTFLPAGLATVADVAGEHFRKDVTGGAELGTGTYLIGYGHDEAADELAFGPFDVTVVATGGAVR